MNNKIDFLTASISDIQATIRAVDVKAGALLTGLLAPFASFGRVWSHFMHVREISQPFIGNTVVVIFFTTWLCALFILIRALAAIDNPANHVINSGKYRGSFYSGGLYDFGILDAVLNRRIIKASKDVATIAAEAPNSESELIDELAFEHIKLIYIRDIKMLRLHSAINIASIWLAIGIGSFLYSKFG